MLISHLLGVTSGCFRRQNSVYISKLPHPAHVLIVGS